MKRIKTYKLFESKLEVIYNVEDMLVELKDIGFEVSVSSPADWLIALEIKKTRTIDRSGRPVPGVYGVSGTLFEDAFKWSDIKEYVERVADYLCENGYSTGKSNDKLGYTESFNIVSPLDFSTSRTTVFKVKFTKDFKI